MLLMRTLCLITSLLLISPFGIADSEKCRVHLHVVTPDGKQVTSFRLSSLRDIAGHEFKDISQSGEAALNPGPYTVEIDRISIPGQTVRRARIEARITVWGAKTTQWFVISTGPLVATTRAGLDLFRGQVQSLPSRH